MLIHHLGDGAQGQRAALPPHRRAVFEEHERRHALDLVLRAQLLVFVDVDFQHAQALAVVLFHLLDGGRQRVAGPAPLGPEVHEYRFVVFGQDVFEGGHGCLFWLMSS